MIGLILTLLTCHNSNFLRPLHPFPASLRSRSDSITDSKTRSKCCHNGVGLKWSCNVSSRWLTNPRTLGPREEDNYGSCVPPGTMSRQYHVIIKGHPRSDLISGAFINSFSSPTLNSRSLMGISLSFPSLMTHSLFHPFTLKLFFRPGLVSGKKCRYMIFTLTPAAHVCVFFYLRKNNFLLVQWSPTRLSLHAFSWRRRDQQIKC